MSTERDRSCSLSPVPLLSLVAPGVGFEPTTLRLTAGCSAVELPRTVACPPRPSRDSRRTVARTFRLLRDAVRARVFTLLMASADDDLWHGVIHPAEAARAMDLAYDRLLDLADRERIDFRNGFRVEDLIRLATKLVSTTPDPQQQAQLRAAVRTFRAIRALDRAA
jgi:hypothetical protein